MAHIETSLITARTQEAVPLQIFTKSRFCPLANLEGRGLGGVSPSLYLAPKSRHRKVVYLWSPFLLLCTISVVLLNSGKQP